MSRTYYPLLFHLDNRDRYLLWHSDDEVRADADGVALDERGAMPVFRTRDDLAAYAQVHGLSPLSDKTPLLHDLDVVRRWLRRKRERPVPLDCAATLAAWNLFADVSRSAGGDFDGDKARTRRIYDKLFWGVNFPSLTPPGKRYIPLWSSAEQRLVHAILSSGLRLFRDRLTSTALARSPALS